MKINIFMRDHYNIYLAMCGIAGIILPSLTISDRDKADIEAMTRILHHRGPTYTGYYQNKNCLLGNARLAITDIDPRSNLPMQSNSGDIVIGYNGFVSNFKELKQRYNLAHKYVFKGNSDTEVLLYLYQENGIDFIKELNGMFALFILDNAKCKAWLVRDFFGIKPLFYMEENKRFYFASELKSFCELKSFTPVVNAESIFHYFTLAYIPGILTPYKNVHELRPGHWIEFNLISGARQIHEYYSLPFETNSTIAEKEAVEQSRKMMQQSVTRNMTADVPLGITLSGGMDSSLILSMASNANLNKQLVTFSLKIDEPGFDESTYQRLMVEQFKPEHHEIKVTASQIEEALYEHIAYLDEPSGNGGNIPSYLLAKEAAKHVTVLLSGEGGDEIFNGYDTHIAYKTSALYRQFSPAWLRGILRSVAHALPVSRNRLSLDFMLKRFTEGAELSIPEAHMFWRHVLTDKEKGDLFVHSEIYPTSHTVFSKAYDGIKSEQPLNRLSWLDTNYFFADDLMVKNDRMFMAHSLETRFPMMDRELAEYVASIPPHLRVKKFKRRNIQKLAAVGLVPEAIINRRKSGLEIPNSVWVLSRLKPLCDSYFTKQKVEETEILNWQAVTEIWQRHKAGTKDHGRAVWCLLIFLIWFDMFVKNSDYKKYMHLNR